LISEENLLRYLPFFTKINALAERIDHFLRNGNTPQVKPGEYISESELTSISAIVTASEPSSIAAAIQGLTEVLKSDDVEVTTEQTVAIYAAKLLVKLEENKNLLTAEKTEVIAVLKVIDFNGGMHFTPPK
jgi:hypothetical protein